jgi:hypothetical protein
MGLQLNSIGNDLIKKSYIKYLIDTYNELILNDNSIKGYHKKSIIWKNLKQKFKNHPFLMPVKDFHSITNYIQKEIEDTKAGRKRIQDGEKLYKTFKEYLDNI